jgi:dTDP-4-dehydrorhamnose 3,5-epimerase
MPFVKTPIADLLVFEPRVFPDERGYFYESFNKNNFTAEGIDVNFVQDNQSYSSYGVVRGLHYQNGVHAQAKLVTVIKGAVLDVVIDLRKDSPTFGQSYSIELNGDNKKQLFIPRGFAHGFSVLSEKALFFYKCDNFYNKESEGGVNLLDDNLNIDWQIPIDEMIISDKDKILPPLKDATYFF